VVYIDRIFGVKDSQILNMLKLKKEQKYREDNSKVQDDINKE